MTDREFAPEKKLANDERALERARQIISDVSTQIGLLPGERFRDAKRIRDAEFDQGFSAIRNRAHSLGPQERRAVVKLMNTESFLKSFEMKNRYRKFLLQMTLGHPSEEVMQDFFSDDTAWQTFKRFSSTVAMYHDGMPRMAPLYLETYRTPFEEICREHLSAYANTVLRHHGREHSHVQAAISGADFLGRCVFHPPPETDGLGDTYRIFMDTMFAEIEEQVRAEVFDKDALPRYKEFSEKRMVQEAALEQTKYRLLKDFAERYPQHTVFFPFLLGPEKWPELPYPGKTKTETIEQKDFAPLIDEAISQLHISNIEVASVSGFNSIHDLHHRLFGMLHHGCWPLFSFSKSPAPFDAFEAREVKFTLNDSIERHFTEMENVVGAKTKEQLEMLENLKGTLQSELPILHERITKIEDGLLPIGLKIHVLNKDKTQTTPEIPGLKSGGFKMESAGTCYILPPVGSMSVLEEIVRKIEGSSGIKLEHNPNIEMQVCLPGELHPQLCAVWGIMTHLCADSVRKFTRKSFETNTPNHTGNRLVIYGSGTQEKNYEFWDKDPETGKLIILDQIPDRLINRTDILCCRSVREVSNAHFIGDLLVHLQHNGFWEDLGKEFLTDFLALLDSYHLRGITEADWVDIRGSETVLKDIKNVMERVLFQKEDRPESLDRFFEAISELTTEMDTEVDRANRTGEYKGIVYAARQLLQTYRDKVKKTAEEVR